jgi:ribonuclease HI
MKLIVHTDGGARGNPGPGAVGVVITHGGKRIAAFGKKIGEVTNNVAEYTAVIEALKYITSHQSPVTEIQFVLDSVLVTNQLMGRYKVKDPDLRLLLLEVRQLEQEVGGSITYTVVPRAQNAQADFLVNQAFDA